MAESESTNNRIDFDAQMQELADQLQAQTESESVDLPTGAEESETPEAEASSDDAMAQLLKSVSDKLERKNKLESANEKLFDLLHSELKSYRDDFLHETLQKPFIKDLITLYDDFGRLNQQCSEVMIELGDNAPERMHNLHHNLSNLTSSITEMMHRLEVEEMDASTVQLDKKEHRVVEIEPTDNSEEDGQITRVVREGFVWRNKVLRPMDVVAKRHSIK